MKLIQNGILYLSLKVKSKQVEIIGDFEVTNQILIRLSALLRYRRKIGVP
jgi:hypothetical protein